MPIYEFQCKKCSNVTYRKYPINSNIKTIDCDRVIHSNNEDVRCDGKAERIISVTNFKINGYSESNGYSKNR